MRKLILPSAVLAAALALPARAQVQVQMHVALPAPPMIHFEVAPPLYEVSPGVQVVEDNDDEIFFNGGWYWCRRDGRWFRTRDWHGGWVYVAPRYVPAPIYRTPPGRYRHWRHEAREARHEEHRELKEEKRERKEDRREDREDRREDHDRGEGHGHGHHER